VVATLRDLPRAVAGLKPPALVVIGEVVRLRSEIAWHERRALAGRRVLVTRAAGQAEKVVRAVAELGGEPMVAPLTRMAPPSDDAPLATALGKLSAYRWLVFTSANAVDHLFAAMAARGLDARALASARLACVGRATAAALARHGLSADLVPSHGDAAGVARAVLERDAAPGAVLVPRAERGREEAAALLTAAGAAVDLVPVYRLEPVPASDPAVAHALARLAAGEVDAVAFFAPSQVRALIGLAGRSALARVKVLAAIGETTAAALRESGLEPSVVASAPDGEALVGRIAAALAKET
jgi:uroporphyrinogen III methyltransferase/synthase